jgi:hypothetical protein
LHHGNTYGVMGALTKINVQRKIPTAKFKTGHCDFQNRSSACSRCRSQAWKQASTPAFRSPAPPLWRLPVRTKTIRLEWLDAHLHLQHAFMPAGYASLKIAQVNQKCRLTVITVSTATVTRATRLRKVNHTLASDLLAALSRSERSRRPFI